MKFHINSLRFKCLLIIFFAFLTQTPAQEENILKNPLKAKASFGSPTIAPGSQATLNIELELAEGHKAFVDMFHIRWKTPGETKVTGFTVDPSFKFEDKFSGKIREGIKQSARLSALVEFPETIDLNLRKVEFEFAYQVCTETYCHFPKTLNLTVPVRVVDAAEFTPGDNPIHMIQDSFLLALGKGTFYTFLFVFLAGILTSLTPCIFPMIPITLAIIGARAADQPRSRGFLLSMAYVFGIAITYALLGVIAARTGSLFGSYLGHPVAVSLIAVVFVAMGLSMYGLFDLQVPSFIINRISVGKISAGYVGSFTTGLIAGVVASPCVGPVLVGILTYVAESQNLTFGFLLLFTFALGLGQLFLVLGTFSNLLHRLPRSGPWMEAIKFIFGTTMIVAALWYLKPVLHPRLHLGLISLTLVLISSGFGVFEKIERSRLKQIKKGFLILLMIFGFSYGAKVVWYKDPVPEAIEISKKLHWQAYSDSVLMAAKRDMKPVILDFWADWCIACKELEAFTFSNPSVRDLSKEFVLLKLDATNTSELVEKLKGRYGVVGLPHVVFINSKGQVLRHLTLTGFENATSFEKRMKQALR